MIERESGSRCVERVQGRRAQVLSVLIIQASYALLSAHPLPSQVRSPTYLSSVRRITWPCVAWPYLQSLSSATP